MCMYTKRHIEHLDDKINEFVIKRKEKFNMITIFNLFSQK